MNNLTMHCAIFVLAINFVNAFLFTRKHFGAVDNSLNYCFLTNSIDLLCNFFLHLINSVHMLQIIIRLFSLVIR